MMDEVIEADAIESLDDEAAQIEVDADADVDVRDKDELLIEFVKSNSHLWNTQDKDYRNREKCNKTWEQIGAELQISGDESQRRWIRLRQYYAKERVKLEKRETKIPNEFYQSMSFIDCHMRKRRKLFKNIRRPSIEPPAMVFIKTEPTNDFKKIIPGKTITAATSTTTTTATATTAITSSKPPTLKPTPATFPSNAILKPISITSIPFRMAQTTQQHPQIQIQPTPTLIDTRNINDRDQALANLIITELRNCNEPKKSQLRRKLMNVIVEHINSDN